MWYLVLAWVAIQAGPAPSAAEKTEAALKRFGQRSYLMRVQGMKAGVVTLKSSVVTEKGRKVAVLEQHSVENGKPTGADVEKADLAGLTLQSIRITLLGGKKPDINTIVVEGGKATLKFTDDEVKKIDVPEKTVGDQGVLRLVCAAEQKEGAEFKLNVLSWPQRDVQARVFKCEEKTRLDILGKKYEAYVWKETAGEGGNQGVNTYWVSSDGYPLKWIGLGGLEYVLDLK